MELSLQVARVALLRAWAVNPSRVQGSAARMGAAVALRSLLRAPASVEVAREGQRSPTQQALRVVSAAREAVEEAQGVEAIRPPLLPSQEALVASRGHAPMAWSWVVARSEALALSQGLAFRAAMASPAMSFTLAAEEVGVAARASPIRWEARVATAALPEVEEAEEARVYARAV